MKISISRKKPQAVVCPGLFQLKYHSLLRKLANVEPLTGKYPGGVHPGRQSFQFYWFRWGGKLLAFYRFSLCIEKAECERRYRAGSRLELDEIRSWVRLNIHLTATVSFVEAKENILSKAPASTPGAWTERSVLSYRAQGSICIGMLF